MSNPHYEDIDEVLRVTAPDGSVDAVVRRMTGRNFRVYVVQKGRPVHAIKHLLSLAHGVSEGGFSLVWQGPRRFAISGEFEVVAPSASAVVEQGDDGISCAY